MFILSSSICENFSFLAAVLFIKKLVNIISIVVPIILIVLLTIDMFKAVVAGDDDKMKQSQRLAVKRIIYALAIFFVPILVEASFNLLGEKEVPGFTCYYNANDETVDSLAKAQKESDKKYKEKLEKSIQDKKIAIEKEKKRKAIKNAKNSSNSSSSTNNTTSTSEKVRNAKTYKKLHVLDTISACSDSFSVSGGNVQGVAVTNDYYVISSDNNVIIVYDKLTKKKLKVYNKNTGHGNGIAYIPNTDTIMIPKSWSLLRTKNYVYFKANNLGFRKKLGSNEAKFSNRAAAVAYDRVLNQYYTGGGKYLWIWAGPSNPKKKKEYYKTLTSGTTQDIGAHNGVVYVCRANAGNYIDLYKASNMKYIGSYKVTVSGELEGIDYDSSNNRFVLAFHGPDKICILKSDTITYK